VRRTVILSDLHMGRPNHGVADPAMLRSLWQGADELVLNGDSAEVHDRTYRGNAARMMLKLQDMCEEDGVRLAVLSGNHDPLITDRRYLRLHAGEVFVCHGDMLHPAISPWTDHARRLTELHNEAKASLDPDAVASLDGQLDISQHASSRNWDHIGGDHPKRPPSAARDYLNKFIKYAKVAWYWHTLPQRAIQFARQYTPDSRFFIFGHIHRAGVWRFGHQTMINTGSYHCPRNPHAVVLDDQVLSVYRVKYDLQNGHRLSDKPRFVAELNHAQQLPPDDADWPASESVHAVA